MINRQIAEIFNEIADILEINGENPFRIRAYRKAAQNIEGLAQDVSEISPEDLQQVPGIGADLCDKVQEFIRQGRIKIHEELKGDIPAGLIDLLSVPGLGPRTVKMLYEKLNIQDIQGLEASARKGLLRALPGIGAKTEENILRGIQAMKEHTGRFPTGTMKPLAEDIVEKLRSVSPVNEIVLAGSLRRWKDTIKDIDIVATSKNPGKVMEAFVRLPEAKKIVMQGPTKSSIITREGIQVDLRVVEDSSFGAALAYFTGSKAHNIRLRERAGRQGLKINEYGIFDVKTDKKLGGKKESDIYRLLGLAYIPPELREDRGEIEAALKNELPELIDVTDIRGDLHIHSRYSDGILDLAELAAMGKRKGYQYIAVTDHSKGLGIAGGMNPGELAEQTRALRALNRNLKRFCLLSGIEVDIRSDGTLDYDDATLEGLDVVVASIHSGFGQTKEQLTKRLLSAISNPCVSIIAHPTGRLMGERKAYDIDMEKVLRAARETGTALEINACPLRLDLSDVFIKKAREMGVTLAISTDAHRENQFDYMTAGVAYARRGWLEKKDVLNSYGLEALKKRLKSKRSRLQTR